jgi:hypothetical protein
MALSIRATDAQKAAERLRKMETTMRQAYTAAMAEATKPIIAAARTNAVSTLPSKGGLGRTIATSHFTVKPLRGKRSGGGVLITTADHDARIDKAGRVRHPVFGRKVYAQQKVKPGWFTKAAKRTEREVTRHMEAASKKVARQVTGGP